jgi:hypothetical protein
MSATITIPYWTYIMLCALPIVPLIGYLVARAIGRR